MKTFFIFYCLIAHTQTHKCISYSKIPVYGTIGRQRIGGAFLFFLFFLQWQIIDYVRFLKFPQHISVFTADITFWGDSYLMDWVNVFVCLRTPPPSIPNHPYGYFSLYSKVFVRIPPSLFQSIPQNSPLSIPNHLYGFPFSLFQSICPNYPPCPFLIICMDFPLSIPFHLYDV